MAKIIPPTTTLPSPQTQSPSTNVAIADTYPGIIRQQSIGSVIKAEVLNLSALGSVEIQTKFGNLIISSDLNYSKGEKLLMQLLKFSPKPNFLIRRAVDEKTSVKFGPPKNKEILNSAKSPSLTRLGSNKIINTNMTSQKIRGSIQSQDSTQSTSAQMHSKIRIGGIFKAKILKVKPGESNVTRNPLSASIADENMKTSRMRNSKNPNGQNLKNRALAVDGNNSRTGIPPIKNGSSPTLLIGSEIEVKIYFSKSNSLLGNGTSPEKGLMGDQVLQGHVVGKSNKGEPILKTPLGDFILNTSSQRNLENAISIEFISGPQKSYTSFSAESTINSIIENGNWPTLNEALELIRGLDSTANQLISNIPVPRAGNQMAANILFFISALRGGDLRSWLGNEAARQIQESRPNLYARLNEEFNQMARPLGEVNTNDWRTAIIPILNGSQFEYLKMHFKGESNKLNQMNDGDSTRFIIDLDLSKLGRIQLDGLVTSKGKHFDLFVRSEVPLGKSMRRDLNNIFIEFMEITGISGKIVIHSTLPFIKVPAPYSSRDDSLGVIV